MNLNLLSCGADGFPQAIFQRSIDGDVIAEEDDLNLIVAARNKLLDLLEWIEKAQRLLERWDSNHYDACYCDAQLPETCKPCLRTQLLAELEEA